MIALRELREAKPRRGKATAATSDRSTTWARLKRAARRLRQDVLTVYFVARDCRTPLWLRMLALAIAAYALSPIDLIPDFIPVLGYLDELILLPLAIALVLKFTPPRVSNDCRARVIATSEKLSSRSGAMMVLAIWLACGAVLISSLIPIPSF